MRKRDLADALAAIPDFDAPRADLEQYRTPPAVAADLLWEANEDGHIKGRGVLDLGCGTGMLSHAAHLLGASVAGLDVDPNALEIARRHTPGEFVEASVADCQLAADTVIMNPPFGAQKKGADRAFYVAAARAVKEANGHVWFLQQPVNERFLHAIHKELGMRIERVLTWDYPIESRFDFHTQGVATVPVGGYLASF